MTSQHASTCRRVPRRVQIELPPSALHWFQLTGWPHAVNLILTLFHHYYHLCWCGSIATQGLLKAQRVFWRRVLLMSLLISSAKLVGEPTVYFTGSPLHFGFPTSIGICSVLLQFYDTLNYADYSDSFTTLLIPHLITRLNSPISLLLISPLGLRQVRTYR